MESPGSQKHFFVANIFFSLKSILNDNWSKDRYILTDFDKKKFSIPLAYLGNVVHVSQKKLHIFGRIEEL